MYAWNLDVLRNGPNQLQVGQVLRLSAPETPFVGSPGTAVAPAAPPPPAPAPVVTEGVAGMVEAAKEMIGTPYVWGGKSASGVDCSGLVFLALKSVGLSETYRTSSALRAWAIPISKAEARAGDLVFGPGHVGIYLGDGKMIDAPEPGKTVGIHTVYSNMTSYGRIPT